MQFIALLATTLVRSVASVGSGASASDCGMPPSLPTAVEGKRSSAGLPDFSTAPAEEAGGVGGDDGDAEAK